MWEAIKNNPLLKTIAIAVLGVLGFGFAFNIMFGSSGEGMGHEMSGGYSLDNTLAYILTVLIKILLIAIVITAIAAVVKYTRKYLAGNNHNTSANNTELIDFIKADPVLKTVTIVVSAILLLGMLFMISGSLFGSGGAYTMPGGYRYSVANGLGLTAIMIFLVRLLLTVSVIGLAVGLILLLLQNKDKISIEAAKFLGSEKAPTLKCKSCGCQMKPTWKCCPNCGTEGV